MAAPDLAPYRSPATVDDAEHELALRANRSANNANNYDPLVDLATPNGSSAVQQASWRSLRFDSD